MEEEEGGKGIKMHREKMQLLVSAFSNAQQDQYEVFRRSSFPKSGVKKIMQVLLWSALRRWVDYCVCCVLQSVCASAVPQNAVIAMAGITKVYIGEVVEAALQARENLGEEGPLQPKHIREAVRRLKKKKKQLI